MQSEPCSDDPLLSFSYLENSNAVHVDFHVIGGLGLCGDYARAVNLLEKAGCRVFSRNLGCLVKKMRRTNVLVVANENLNFDRLPRVSAQLHHWIPVTRLVLDGAATALS